MIEEPQRIYVYVNNAENKGAPQYFGAKEEAILLNVSYQEGHTELSGDGQMSTDYTLPYSHPYLYAFWA